MDFLDLSCWRDVRQNVPNAIQYLIDKQRPNFPTKLLERPDTVYWKNRDGFYLGCNDTHAELFGYARGCELVGVTSDELLPEPYCERVKYFDNFVMSSGIVMTLEEKGHDLAGNQCIYISHKFPVFGHGGGIDGFIGLSVQLPLKLDAEQKFALLQCRQRALEQLIKQLVRGPVAAVRIGQLGLQQHLSQLMTGYENACKANLVDAPLSQEKLDTLRESLTDNLAVLTKLEENMHFIISSMSQLGGHEIK